MQRWWHSFGGMLSLCLTGAGGEAIGGAGRGYCSHGTQPAPSDSRDAGAPAASGSWRKAQMPPGRPGGGACSLPAAEGEGASSALRCAALAEGVVGAQTRAGRQAPSAQATGSSSPLATGRGSHAPCSGVTAPELGRKRGAG